MKVWDLELSMGMSVTGDRQVMTGDVIPTD